jgi:hypothetical protein
VGNDVRTHVSGQCRRNFETPLALTGQLRYLGTIVIAKTTYEHPSQTKEELPMNHTMSLQDCARMLNVQSYQIQYAYAHRRVPEPQLRVAGRRLFTPDDVQRLAAHFGVKLPETELAEPATEVAGV